jgi:hypothetical protein
MEGVLYILAQEKEKYRQTLKHREKVHIQFYIAIYYSYKTNKVQV